MIRAEAAQRHERASYVGIRSKKDRYWSPRSDNSRSIATSFGGVEFLSKVYQPLDPSYMTPMERFATLSPANDPCPWESRKTMTQVGLEEGTMETLHVRIHAAVVVDDTRKSAKVSALTVTGWS